MSNTLFNVTENALSGGGIFSTMDAFEPPWVADDMALELDIIYYGNYSGDKVTSPLVDRFLTRGKISDTDMITIAQSLLAVNRERWQREWDTLSAQYDPIANYDMTEELEDDETVTAYGHTRTRTDNLAHSETRTDNLTHSVDNTEVETPAVTNTQQESTRAFNSNSDVNTTKITRSNSGTNRTVTDGTERDTGTQSTSGSNTGTQADAESGSDTSTRNYKLTRKGNIGVTTSQQMLTSERELWKWNYFYEIVFPDADQMLTSPCYSEGEISQGVNIDPESVINIIQNGLFNVTRYASALVEVPNSYSADDEYKVVYGGHLIEQGEETIITNGRHDTQLTGFVNVEVPPELSPADEGKVVNNGSLVQQTSEIIYENGIYDTTLINQITANILRTKFSNYNFETASFPVYDSIKNYEAAGYNLQYSADGAIFQSASSHIQLPNTWTRNMTIEIEFGSVSSGSGSQHQRMLTYTSDSGLIFRSNGKWAFYGGGAWAADSDITAHDYFEDSTLKVVIDSDYYWHIYKDNVLVYEPDRPMSTGGVYISNPVIIGGTSQSFYQCYIKNVSIYY